MNSEKSLKKLVKEAIPKINGRIKPIVGCVDCQIQWETYCPLCKKKGSYLDGSNLRKALRQLGLLPVKNDIDKPKKTNKIQNTPPVQPTPISTDNFHVNTTGAFEEIYSIPDGFTIIFESKASTYYVNKDKTQVVRESDHWGLCIKYCSWFLKGTPYIRCSKWKKLYEGEFKIGIIDIIDFKPNSNKK